MNWRTDLTFAQSENCVFYFWRVTQFEELIGCRNRPGLSDLQMKFRGQLGQRSLVGLANCRCKLVRNAARLIVCPGEHQRSANRILHFFERLGVSSLFLQDFDDVKAVLRLHQIRNGAYGLCESRFLELGYGLALNEPA